MLDNISDSQLWNLFGEAQQLLKTRGLIRTNNIVGERGEFLAIEIYNKTPNLPKLQAAPEGTQNVDAISRKGERYSIKTITLPGKTTGVFYGCGDIDSNIISDRKFEFVIIVQIGKDFSLQRIIELNWEQFLHFRKWHSTMRAWNISITRKLITEAKIVYEMNNKD